MKSHAVIMVLSGLVVAVLIWVFAIRSASWAPPFTEPFFIVGTLLELALAPDHTRTPDLWVIILGYAVNFLITWAVMALLVGLIIRLVSKRRGTA
jgi:hypothetical protein